MIFCDSCASLWLDDLLRTLGTEMTCQAKRGQQYPNDESAIKYLYLARQDQ